VFKAPIPLDQLNIRMGRLMDILDQKTDQELQETALCELAKMSNELKCAKNDLQKANNRLNFALVLINRLIDRKGD